MPAPTRNPIPTPKSPPVCKKPPTASKGAAPGPETRILTAHVTGLVFASGLPGAINETITLRPIDAGYHWEGFTTAGDMFITVGVFKNPADDYYSLEIEYSVGGPPFFFKDWDDIKPRRYDPLEFAELSYEDPSTGDSATLIVMS